MTTVTPDAAVAPDATGERPHPPFTQVGMAALALVVIGGIYLSSKMPEHVPLGLPVTLLVASPRCWPSTSTR